MLKAGDQRSKILKQIADGKVEGATVSDRIRAIELMFKVGLQTGITIDAVREKLKATVVMIESRLDEETAAPIIDDMRVIWLGEH